MTTPEQAAPDYVTVYVTKEGVAYLCSDTHPRGVRYVKAPRATVPSVDPSNEAIVDTLKVKVEARVRELQELWKRADADWAKSDLAKIEAEAECRRLKGLIEKLALEAK